MLFKFPAKMARSPCHLLSRRKFFSFGSSLKRLFDAPLEPPAVELLSELPVWATHADDAYGGKSEAGVELLGISSNEEDEENPPPMLRFWGVLRAHPKLGSSEQGSRSTIPGSFSAAKAEELASPIDLRGYEGLELVMESNVSRTYKMNMECSSALTCDLFQLTFGLRAQEKIKMHIPFRSFKLTRGGRVSAYERNADSLQVCSIGFLAAERSLQQLQQARIDGEEESTLDTPFELKVYSVRALTTLDRHRVARMTQVQSTLTGS